MRSSSSWRLTLLVLLAASGCATGPIQFVSEDTCNPAIEPGSAQWWAERAQAPPGVRQKCHKGKMWPVQPRPAGEPQQFTHTYHSAHYWPLPYVCQDRTYLSDIVKAQERKGWQQETTLYDRHFTEGETLNVPGQLQLIDILEVTPSEFRTIYVQSSYDVGIDNARVANVQNAVQSVTGGVETVSVQLRRGRDYSRPAAEVRIINDLYNDSLPSPRLGAAGGGGGGGGLGGGLTAGP